MGSVGNKRNIISFKEVVKKLQSWDRTNYINPIPVASKELQKEIRSILGRLDPYAYIKKSPEYSTINVQKLTTLQTTLIKSHLKNLSSVESPLDSDKMIVYKYKGNYIVLDGNHRLALDYIRGVQDKKVPIIDVDKFQQRYRKGD